MLIPCIDLQGGKAVQLVHGRRCELVVDDVIGLLERFKTYPWLHIIDLDAAMGEGQNDELVHELCTRARNRYKMKVRLGGGIRTVKRALELTVLGATQIIIGSAAFQERTINEVLLRQLIKKIPRKKIVIALDTRKGRITVHGWRRGLALRAQDVMAQLEPFCGGFLCTDVDREGTMSGANLKWFRMLRQATEYPIIAAGGIKTHREIDALQALGMQAAVGMAVYKKRVQ